MKEFWIYTLMRLGLFVASFAVVCGIWLAITQENSLPLLPPLLIALIVSGIASYFLLNGPRDALARRVQARAEAASSKFEAHRAREDDDAADPAPSD